MNTTEHIDSPPRSRWGRARFGGGSGLLLALSLILGAILASGIGWVFVLFGSERVSPTVSFLSGAVVTLPVSVMLVWALLVDRSTLIGASADPDSSIENLWYERAASGAFTDLIATLGLGAAVFSFVRPGFSVGLVLCVLAVLAAVDFVVRYLLAKKADS